MPGRQAHGRPLLPTPSKGQARHKSTAKARANILDAFALAAEQVQPERRLPRGRDRDLEPELARGRGKHSRDEDDDEEDDDEDGESDFESGPRKKRSKKSALDDESESDGDDLGNDSDGPEWHEGVNSDDEDSEIDSDEAFESGDEERFEGFAFRGSSSTKNKKNQESDEEEEDDDSLGEDAIDLAQALDQGSDDEGSTGDTESGSDEDDESAEDDGEEDEDGPSRLDALQSIIKGYAGDEAEDGEQDASAQSNAKISLADLGLFGVKDANMKKSLKLMKKEESANKPGASKKLEVPLAKRQQDRLLRAAAYDKTNETLNRWTETVKHNRRADHLVFPLANTLANAGLDNGELAPVTRKTAGSELEQTIMSIMEESGLGPSARPKEQNPEDEEDGAPSISRAELQEVWAQRRREREAQSREQARAKRIKKIKSKTYRRVHRKERLRDELAAEEAMDAEEGVDSDEEREAQHRQRAMERMGLRHRDSKWAKMGKKAGRAAWDENFRAGLTDMARRDHELRRRVEGRAEGSDDDRQEDDDATSSSGDDDGNDRNRLLRELDDLDNDDDTPQSNLMKMAFMQRAEAARKQANDELVAQMRRELASDAEDDVEDGSDAGEVEVGRRTYGVPKSKSTADGTARAPEESEETNPRPKQLKAPGIKHNTQTAVSILPSPAEPQTSTPGAAGAWSRAGTSERRKSKKQTGSNAVAELDLNSSILIAKASKASKPNKAASRNAAGEAAADDSDSEDAMHLPLAIRDQELVARAFAGEDVVGEFQRDKDEVASEDDEKVVDNTLPGWGSWVGDGVSNRDKKRNQGRFLTKTAGINKKDRKDAKLEKVIISEKRVHKNDKYLASQLPHPFESRHQYERALRLPMGPEWMTKQSFQETTKPRVIMKQGIIAPISKPVL